MPKTVCQLLIAYVTFILGSTTVWADVVVLSNRTSVSITFRQMAASAVGGADLPTAQTVAPNDFATVHCSGPIKIGYSDGQNPIVHKLDANCAYQFIEQGAPRKQDQPSKQPVRQGQEARPPEAVRRVLLEKIYLAGDARTLDGTGIARNDNLLKPKSIPVKIYVDDNQRSATALWQRQLTKRLEQASAIFEKHCLLTFHLAGFGEWDSDEKIKDFAISLAEFEHEIPAVPGGFVIGFTSQYSVSSGANKLGGTRGPMHPHILISEQSTVISEGERLEVLVHELGHCLGAAHSIDPHSVMRPLLGDRLARAADFKIQFDPANTVALNLLSEEIRLRNASRRTQLLPATGLRLTQIHQELDRRLNQRRIEELARRQQLNEQKNPPKKLVAKNAPPAQKSNSANPMPDPVAAAGKNGNQAAAALFNLVLNKDLASQELRSGTRTILQDVVAAAELNAALPLPKSKTVEEDPYEGVLFGELSDLTERLSSDRLAATPEEKPKRSRLTGDRLTAYYVRVAAAAADRLPKEHANSAFLLALGIAVDSSDILHKVPQTSEFCQAVEPMAQRSRRLKALGQPTVRGRRDLAQHFVVSAHLTVALGRATAEAAGMAKEIIDAERGSGFSFADLTANKAGIRLATQLEKQTISLQDISKSFQVANFVPDVDGLPEGLGSQEFQTEYGNGSGDKFTRTLAEIDNRLSRLAAYR